MLSANILKFAGKTGVLKITAIVFLLSFQPVAANSSGSDVLLILDTSGSMAASDSHALRKQAAKMFVALMGQNDRVAVMRFSGKAQVVTGLNKLSNSSHKNRVIKSIDQVSSRGAWTNIYQALDKGHQLLRKNRQTNRSQFIILMSDGKMDVGDKTRDQALIEKTLGPLTQKMAKDRIKVHSIAFTNSTSLPLLQLASKDTKGFFTVLKGASGIHEIFETLFERSVSPDMLPITEDSFVVDESIKEMTIVVSKYKPSSKVALESPEGKTFYPRTIHPSLNWVKAKQYDLITIKNPSSGYWRIKFSEGGNRAYVYTDLKLKMEAASEVLASNDFEFYVWLEKNGTPVKSNTLLKATNFILNISHPDGKKTRHVLKKSPSLQTDKKGVLTATLAFSTPGTYKLEVTGKSDAFDRKKSHFVTVKAPVNQDPFKVLDADSTTETLSSETKETMHVEPVALNQTTESTKPATDEKIDEVAKQPEEVTQAPQIEEAQPEETGEKHNEATTEKEEETTGGKKALMIFLVINTLLGTGVLGFFLWRKFRKNLSSGKRSSSLTDDINSSGFDLGNSPGIDLDSETSFDVDKELDQAGLGEDVDMMNQDFDDIDLDEIDEEGAMEADVDTTLDQTGFDQPKEAS